MKKHHWHTILHAGIVLHFLAYLILSLVAVFGNVATRPVRPASAATFDVKSFVGKSSPNTTHEGNPHGVPTYYSWYNIAEFHALTQPRAETTHVNFWGEVYHDTSNAHPANTRVALKNCQFWGLFNGTWTQIQASTLDGGAWVEDYTTYAGGMDVRTESDGSQSVLPRLGQNAHFWVDTGFYNMTGKTFQAAITTCQSRLVLANPSGTDDRDSARYILAMGADWRQPDGSCPFIYGSYICEGLGHGRYIRVTKEWRTAVMTSMSASDLASMPAPPSSMFLQPDGSYPDMAPEISSFSANPTNVAAGSPSTLSWNVKGAGNLSINQGVGAVSGTSKSVNPSATTTYTLTASNTAGSATATATVTVPGTTPVPNSGGGSSSGGGASSDGSPGSGGTSSGGGGAGTASSGGGRSNDSAQPTIVVNEDGIEVVQGGEEVVPVPVGGVDLPGVNGRLRVGSIDASSNVVALVGGATMVAVLVVSGVVLYWWRRRMARMRNYDIYYDSYFANSQVGIPGSYIDTTSQF